MSSDNSVWIPQIRSTLLNAEYDFFRHDRRRYWFDFLLSLALTYGFGSLYLMMPLGTWPQVVAFPFAVFWLYRLTSLVHEVAHLGHGEMRAFKVTWNLLAGVMTLTPSPFFTRHHRDHHTCRFYGTSVDPEYISNIVPGGNWRNVLWYAAEILVFPLLVWLRFLFAPITFFHPHWRRFILRRGSSLTMNWHYERALNDFDRKAIAGMEILCCLRAAFIPMAILAGIHDWTRIPLLYLLAVATLALNQLRLLADHHLSSDGNKLDLEDHILDSCNFVQQDFLTWLFFPFAIRYHALHHLFPTLPYHNLAAAHQFLSDHLPSDSPYHSLSQPGWWSVAKNAFRGRQARKELMMPVASI